MRREGIGRAVSWHCLSCQIFFVAPMLPTEIAASEDEGFINNWIELTADIQNQNDVQEWCMAGCSDVQAWLAREGARLSWVQWHLSWGCALWMSASCCPMFMSCPMLSEIVPRSAGPWYARSEPGASSGQGSFLCESSG